MNQAAFNVVNLGVGVVLAFVVARMVGAAGRTMLDEAFPHRAELVEVVTRVVVVSFSLICGGYLVSELGIFLIENNPSFGWDTASVRLEIGSLGWLSVFLGVNLFFHLFVLSQIRGRGRRRPRHDEHHGESILA
jgi:hypothetical protein